MTTIVTRAAKGSALSWTEVDANFTNLNTAKAELSGASFTGNVGIGTSSPGAKLDVAGNVLLSGQSTADQYIRVGSGRSGNGYSYIDLQGDTTYSNGLRLIRTNGGANSSSNIEHRGTGQLQLITQEAAPITFLTTATERARIDSSGNVGIGTSSPTAGFKLDVNGAAMAAAYCFGHTNRHLFYDVSATEIGIRVGTAGPYYGIGTTGSDTMRINNASGGDMLFSVSGSEYMRINYLGNVGIGTSSPGYKLDVNGTGSFVGSSGVGAIRVAGAGGSWFWIDNPTTTTMRFSSGATAGTNPMVLDSSGNVGIGTSSPSALLDVNADTVRVRTAKTPASATATGNAGDICWDSNYVYVCVATNTWKRSALSTW